MSRLSQASTPPHLQWHRTRERSSPVCPHSTIPRSPGVTANSVLADLRTRLSVIKDAYVLTIPPPPVQGLGSAGGFKMMLEDRTGFGSEAVVRAANDLVAAANQDPHLAGTFTL